MTADRQPGLSRRQFLQLSALSPFSLLRPPPENSFGPGPLDTREVRGKGQIAAFLRVNPETSEQEIFVIQVGPEKEIVPQESENGYSVAANPATQDRLIASHSVGWPGGFDGLLLDDQNNWISDWYINVSPHPWGEGEECQPHPSVVFDSQTHQYLVVASGRATSSGPWTVAARLVDAEGQPRPQEESIDFYQHSHLPTHLEAVLGPGGQIALALTETTQTRYTPLGSLTVRLFDLQGHPQGSPLNFPDVYIESAFEPPALKWDKDTNTYLLALIHGQQKDPWYDRNRTVEIVRFRPDGTLACPSLTLPFQGRLFALAAAPLKDGKALVAWTTDNAIVYQLKTQIIRFTGSTQQVIGQPLVHTENRNGWQSQISITANPSLIHPTALIAWEEKHSLGLLTSVVTARALDYNHHPLCDPLPLSPLVPLEDHHNPLILSTSDGFHVFSRDPINGMDETGAKIVAVPISVNWVTPTEEIYLPFISRMAWSTLIKAFPHAILRL